MAKIRPPLDQEALNKLMAIIEEFRKVNSEMTLQQAMSLLWIAKEQGDTISSLCNKVGVSLAGASRHVEVLGMPSTKQPDAAGLIQADYDDLDRRKKVLVLTSDGYRVLNSLIKLIRS